MYGWRAVPVGLRNAEEDQDTIRTLGARRLMPSSDVTVLGWDPVAKRAVAAGVPTAAQWGGPQAPRLEQYLPGGLGSGPCTDTTQAGRAATLIAQALEARHKTWFGRSSVRTFGAGAHFHLTQSMLDGLDGLGGSPGSSTTPEPRRFLLTRVLHCGINNLPRELSARIAQTLDAPDPLLHVLSAQPFEGLWGDSLGDSFGDSWADDFGSSFDEDPLLQFDPPIELPPELLAQAAERGYANHFEAIRAAIPWRAEATGCPASPPYPGMLTATVIGPEGQTQGQGAEAIHMDRWGRIRIAFDFQLHRRDEEAGRLCSTWVRVLQRWAGPGMGAQFIPRIGQQVLVDFMDGDLERPVVICGLHDGRGEGGIPRTPGGQAAGGPTSDASVFAGSTDHRAAGQANTSGGRSPAWHGASPGEIDAGGQRNAAALSGYKSEEFGGAGFNQLVFDDSDQQLRAQLASTQHASQLNIGHLIHQADNHRGSLRGLGFELRTDAYGAVRGGQGVLLSSYGTQQAEPAGDNAAAIALQAQLLGLANSFGQAAGTHQITKLAAVIGSFKANSAAISDKEAPAQALHTAVKGMVSDKSLDEAQADAAAKSTSTAEGKLPHSTDPTVFIAAKAGAATVAGQDIQMAAAELIHIASGQDTHLASGGAARIHTGQSIGMLGGAVGPGSDAAGKGVTMIAGAGDIDIQAQADALQVAAKQTVSIQSQSGSIDCAAPKRIVLATKAGASVTLDGGNIVAMCPGKITIEASVKSFSGPQAHSHTMPALPRGKLELNGIVPFSL
jgi:type VI secretion system secreted protein VgrG